MAREAQSPAILQFGVFDVDLRAGELRKQGKRIKLQDQPFQVLAVLLQQPGDVVTREELRSQIWPQDTFVDFDNSLNTAINKLRDALGDSAENPRFIETLPRRGYRFLPSVTGFDGAKEGSLKASPAKRARSWKIIAGMTAIIVAAGIPAGFVWRSRHQPQLTERDTIVLGDFANSTGDPVFDGTLREGLSVELQQSPFLSLVSDEGIHRTLRMMGKRANERLTPETAREICRRANSAAALDGSITLFGTRYNLILKAVNCASGDLLASTEVQASDKSHVLDALGKSASEMRRKLGESLSTLQKYNTPLEQVTTPSLEALQAYSLGLKVQELEAGTKALLFFEKATQLDPNFAMAYWARSNFTADITWQVEGARKAFELRGGLSEREKLLIETTYYYTVTGDLMKARRSCEMGAQMYPRDSTFPDYLPIFSNALGEYEASLKESLQAHRSAPSSPSYRHLVYSYLLLERIKEADAIAGEAHAKGQDSDLAGVLYGIAFYRDDTTGMAQQVARSTGVPRDEDLLLAMEADTAAYFGHLGKARELTRRAAESAELAAGKGSGAGYDAVSALREALFGNAPKARQRAIAAKGHPTGRDLDYAAALALAYARDVNGAQALASDLGKRFPEDTIVQVNYLPTLRAKLALLRANPQQALDALEAAAPHELGLPSLNYYNWPNLYPIYVRGEAYLAARKGREAAAEFQKILNHRGIVLNEPIGVLAHLQLGRAYVLQDETAKARAAYQDFLTLWKDADADIPILIQAKAEYAKLQ